MEIWLDIPDTDGKLQVSSEGRVRSRLRGDWRILKTQADNKGYLRLTYTYKRERRREKLHRLVALMFVPPAPGRTHVNHRNGDKTDNRACNLEWCTNKENAHHAIANGMWDSVLAGSRRENESRMKPVVAIEIATGASREYKSVSDAERACGTKHVCAVIKGKRKKANGYLFRYAV